MYYRSTNVGSSYISLSTHLRLSIVFWQLLKCIINSNSNYRQQQNKDL
jgi:hypothetical protein